MKKVGIFIDHENLAYSSKDVIKEDYNIEVLLARAKEEGRVIMGKAYVPFLPDSSARNGKLYKFHKSGIDPVYTASYEIGRTGKSKSLGDSMLMCDVMESLYERPAIDVFVICSGDKDVIPLLRKIAEQGKDVVVIGVRPTSALALIEECRRLEFRFEDYLELHRPIARRANHYSKRFSRLPPKTS